MPTQVIWDNPEKTIIRHVYIGNATITDYMAVAQLNAAMLNTVSHPVDVIITLTNVNPNSDGFLRGAHYANKIIPKNQRLVVIVNADVHMQGLVKMVAKFTPDLSKHTHFVDTLDEAYHLITKHHDKARA